MKKLSLYLLCLLLACDQKKPNALTTDVATRQLLLSLERRWIEAEFGLDTAYIASLLDSAFMNITPDQIYNKQQELDNIYANMSTMRRAGAYLDSLKLEDPIVHLHGHMAIVTFISHTYKTEKGKPAEKRMRFYDVWMKRNKEWKALSSQGITVQEVK